MQTRSMRAERRSRHPSNVAPPAGAALQIFVSRIDAFLGTELFGTDLPVTIGRHRDTQLRLDDDSVSRVHARLTLEGTRVMIEDVGSANGTLVNRRRITGKVELAPSDAVHVGAYTLKVRPLIPASLSARPNSEISDKTTRLKAILSADGTQGTQDDSIDLGHGVDLKLYEAAVRRATGLEAARSPIPLVVVPGGRERMDSSTEETHRPAVASEFEEDEHTRRDSVVAAVAQVKAMPCSKAMRLDPRIDQRINELEQMMRQIEHPSVAESAPKRDTISTRGRTYLASEEEVFAAVGPTPTTGVARELIGAGLAKMDSDAFARYLASELRQSIMATPDRPEPVRAREPSKTPRRALARDFSVVPAQHMTDGSESTTSASESHLDAPQQPIITLPRDAAPTARPERSRVVAAPRSRTRSAPARPGRSRVGAPHSETPNGPTRVRVEQPRKSAPSRAKLTPPEAPKKSQPRAGRVEKPTFEPPMVRARRVPVGSDLVPSAIVVPRGIPVQTENVRAQRPPPLPARRTPSVTPRAPMGAPRTQLPRVPAHRANSSATPIEPAPLHKLPTPPPLPTAAVTPNVPGPRGDSQVRPRQPIPARLVTPTAMRISVQPMVRRGSPAPETKGWNPIDSDEILASNPASAIDDDSDFTEAIEDMSPVVDPFDGVEIVARGAGRLLDIATLRNESDQYVLGHRTPQGARAPHVAHTGLRLLRITDDRMVDLVFPADAAGHLVRDGETVMFRELAQGRKYSCVRLSPADVATIIIRRGDDQITYHVRFLRSPRL